MQTSNTILLVEDDDAIAVVIEDCIESLGFEMERASDGRSGLDMALDNNYMMIILDIMLPKLDGLEVCQKLRNHKSTIPILMITAKEEDSNQILGLEFGADDYVKKPFNIQTFKARIKALLRRAGYNEENQTFVPSGQAKIKAKNLCIHPMRREVTIDDKEIELTAKEFDMLLLMAQKPGIPFTRGTIIEEIWGEYSPAFDTAVNTVINRLRTKIEKDPADPEFVLTVRGVGYRFTPDK